MCKMVMTDIALHAGTDPEKFATNFAFLRVVVFK